MTTITTKTTDYIIKLGYKFDYEANPFMIEQRVMVYNVNTPKHQWVPVSIYLAETSEAFNLEWKPNLQEILQVYLGTGRYKSFKTNFEEFYDGNFF